MQPVRMKRSHRCSLPARALPFFADHHDILIELRDDTFSKPQKVLERPLFVDPGCKRMKNYEGDPNTRKKWRDALMCL